MIHLQKIALTLAPRRAVSGRTAGVFDSPPIQYHNSVQGEYRQHYLSGSPTVRNSDHTKQQWGGLE